MECLPPPHLSQHPSNEGSDFLYALEYFGGGVHGGYAGTDVAGEILEGFGGGFEAVEEGFGGGVDELALEVAEGEGGGVHVATVCVREGGVETKDVTFGQGLTDVGEGLRQVRLLSGRPGLLRRGRRYGAICSVLLHYYILV